MVLLEEPPQKLIASVAENFNISSDVASIVRINSNLHTLEEARGKRLKDSRHLLRLLSRKVALSKQAAEDAQAQEKERTHGDDMVRLDRDKFALAKSVNELESQSHNLEGQLARLREELEAVDREDPAQTALMDAEDGTLLKLKVYRSLGIELQEDGTGEYSKAVVRNPSKGDVHVVNIENKFSPFFYANYFWSSM